MICPQTGRLMLVKSLKRHPTLLLLLLLVRGCIAPYVGNLREGSGVGVLPKEKLLQAARLLWFEDHISQRDSAPPGSHLYLTILTPNTTFPSPSPLPPSIAPRSLSSPLLSPGSLRSFRESRCQV